MLTLKKQEMLSELIKNEGLYIRELVTALSVLWLERDRDGDSESLT